MDLIQPDLYATVAGTAAALFSGRSLTRTERSELTLWLLARQSPRRGFLYSLPEAKGRRLPALLTGETPRTLLLGRNAFECEVLRLLALLGDGEPGLEQSLATADHRLSRLCFASVCTVGECAGASIAYLRYLSARHPAEDKVRSALEVLHRARDAKGAWHKFPFWYSLLFLAELPAALAGEELDYARSFLVSRPLPAPVHPLRAGLKQRLAWVA